MEGIYLFFDGVVLMHLHVWHISEIFFLTHPDIGQRSGMAPQAVANVICLPYFVAGFYPCLMIPHWQ